MARKALIGLFVLLAIADAFGALFSLSLLATTLSGVNSPGSHDALIGVMALDIVAIPVTILLFVTTAAGLALRSVPLWCRITALLLATTGLVAALASWHSMSRDIDSRKRGFQRANPVYASGLHAAVEEGDIARVKTILDANPQSIPELLHTDDYEGNDPLHLAIGKRDRRMVQTLLGYKTSTEDGYYGDIVNRPGRYRRTPLHCAVIAHDVEIVAILLRHGAEINVEDEQHKTALAYAKESGDSETVRMLVKHGGTLVDYETEAIDSIRRSDRTRLEHLIKQGLVVPRAHQSYLLRVAAQEKDIKVAQLLLDQGADVNAPGTRDAGTPLHEAANFGHVEMIRFLISKGANVHAKNKWNIEPIGWAVFQGKEEAVKVLLDLGADPNTPASVDGHSCLRVAEEGRHLNLVKLLQQHGAR